ncbi:hypothetical protein Rhe02_57100 [Rhizocola hellebori]|uniref:Uncharacterized protein n=1 Tax=Rhizocola hellebori TaxID=1392758 RepID=A0A8J3QDD9_9ACTN|nr:hypothetical protein [Rhizocola hellebori]GIH07643.1 hypothetical protein Rhe02_57100 [Rhizocola hellebori]
MNEHRRHLDRETAEQLLDGVSPTRAAGADRLAELLAAAGGPPRPYEYAREEEAVLAFRAAPAPARRRPSWRKLLTFKVLAITATITVGGLAFASTTGIIPGPFSQSPGVSPTGNPTSNTPGRSRASSPASPTPASSAAAAFGGLCNSYLSKDAQARSKALTTPAYADLVTAAGGADRVEAYCTALPDKEKADKSKDPKPTHEPNPPHASRR